MAKQIKTTKEVVTSSRFSKCAEFLCSLGFKTAIRTKDNVEYLNVYVGNVKQGYMAYNPERELDAFYMELPLKPLYALYNQHRGESK